MVIEAWLSDVGTPPQLCLAMEEEKLSTDFQKLGVRVDKSEEPGEQHAGHSTGDDGAASEATAMHSFNYMLDLNVPGHFATQASARRFLQSVMCLGCHEVRACVRSGGICSVGQTASARGAAWYRCCPTTDCDVVVSMRHNASASACIRVV